MVAIKAQNRRVRSPGGYVRAAGPVRGGGQESGDILPGVLWNIGTSGIIRISASLGPALDRSNGLFDCKEAIQTNNCLTQLRVRKPVVLLAFSCILNRER